jgi:hypothetical protein
MTDDRAIAVSDRRLLLVTSLYWLAIVAMVWDVWRRG